MLFMGEQFVSNATQINISFNSIFTKEPEVIVPQNSESIYII